MTELEHIEEAVSEQSSTKSLQTERLKFDFVQLGVEYYVCGRFAFLNLYPPLVGNLMHHAIEMLLKDILMETYTVDELKENFHHRLTELWSATKKVTQDTALANFDGLIAKLDRFGRIRYPDRVVNEGATIQLGLRSGDDVNYPISASNPATSYQLALEDIDRLVKTLFKLTDYNPKVCLMKLRSDAPSVLASQNLHPFYET